MLVRDLVLWLSRFDPTTTVLLDTPNGLREPEAPEQSTALLDLDGDWHADDGRPEEEIGRRVDVVLIWPGSV